MYPSAAERDASIKFFNLIGSLYPWLFSTPDETSTPQGLTCAIASPTFSGVSPPASKIRKPEGISLRRLRSNSTPDPGLGESTKIKFV